MFTMSAEDSEILVNSDQLAQTYGARPATEHSDKRALSSPFNGNLCVKASAVHQNHNDLSATPESREFSLTFPEASDSQSSEEWRYVPCRKMYLAAFGALMNIVVFGMASSYSAPAGEDMKQANRRIKNISENQITWIASLISIGSMFGAACSAYISHRFGRKAVLIFCSLPYTLGWIAVAYAPTIGCIYAGRVLTGICTGIAAAIVPVYIVEISTPEIRGLLGCGFQISFATGVLLTMSFGSIMPWSWLAIISAVPVVVGLCILYFMPESPHWLISKGRGSDAMQAMTFLQGSKFDAVSECVTIYQNQVSQPINGISVHEYLEPRIYKPLLLSFALMFFQQFAGINALMSYTVSIFGEVGSSVKPSDATIIVAAVQVIASALSGILMDKAGRRVLFITSGIFLCLGLFFLGLFEMLMKKEEAGASEFGWVPVLSFMVYVAAYALGYGPIPWIMIPEMVPLYARSSVLGMTSVFNFMCMFFVTKTFEDLKMSIQQYGVFWLYSCFAALGCLFCWGFLPETKGKPLHDIQKGFSSARGNAQPESPSSPQGLENSEPTMH